MNAPAPTPVKAAPSARQSRGEFLRTACYAAGVVCYLIIKVGRLDFLLPLLSVLTVACIVVSLPVIKWPSRILTAAFIGGGSWMLWQRHIEGQQYLLTYGEMMYLLALFCTVPILAVPVRLGGYNQAIQAVLGRRISGVMQLNCAVSILAYLLGCFLNLAAIPIMFASMSSVISKYPVKNASRFTTTSAIYGYALPILWTPVAGVGSAVLYTTKVDWLQLIPSMLSLSLGGLLVQWMIFYWVEVRGQGGHPVVPPDTKTEVTQDGTSAPLWRLGQMALAIVLLVTAIVGLDKVSHIGMVTLVTLVAVPHAFIWCLANKQGRSFWREGGAQMRNQLPRMADQFAVFLAAGFFVKALHLTGNDHLLNQLFLHLNVILGTKAFLVVLPLLILLCSFIGMHPIVVITLLAESLKPALLGISTLQLAVCLLGGAIMTFILGPFSGTLGLVQSLTRVSTFRLSLWNMPYALGYFVLLTAVIMIV